MKCMDNKINIKPIFIIGDVVRDKNTEEEHLITGVSLDEQSYSIDDDQPMIAWFFPFSWQDKYVKVGHKRVRKGNVIYE